MRGKIPESSACAKQRRDCGTVQGEEKWCDRRLSAHKVVERYRSYRARHRGADYADPVAFVSLSAWESGSGRNERQAINNLLEKRKTEKQYIR